MSDFHRNRSKPDGLHHYCKPCMSDFQKRRYETTLRERNRQRRERAIAAYGGRCACCGETQFEFLGIDHVHNDGAQHRRDIGTRSIYPWLEKHGFPQDGRFQVLCHNCNMAKQHVGECPHVKATQSGATAHAG